MENGLEHISGQFQKRASSDYVKPEDHAGIDVDGGQICAVDYLLRTRSSEYSAHEYFLALARYPAQCIFYVVDAVRKGHRLAGTDITPAHIRELCDQILPYYQPNLNTDELVCATPNCKNIGSMSANPRGNVWFCRHCFE